MAGIDRAREALRAWQDHLITEAEALENAGVDDRSDLDAIAGPDEHADSGC